MIAFIINKHRKLCSDGEIKLSSLHWSQSSKPQGQNRASQVSKYHNCIAQHAFNDKARWKARWQVQATTSNECSLAVAEIELPGVQWPAAAAVAVGGGAVVAAAAAAAEPFACPACSANTSEPGQPDAAAADCRHAQLPHSVEGRSKNWGWSANSNTGPAAAASSITCYAEEETCGI